MNVEQLHRVLEENQERALRLQLPTGEYVPDHFHVTEVGRVDKNFIDCGGTRRHSATCLLQTWTANDWDHRLESRKLAKILNVARAVLGSTDLPIEIEYGPEIAVQYQLADVDVGVDALTFVLAGKQTDCLAKEKCGPAGCDTDSCCR